jgi:hypothetical protein
MFWLRRRLQAKQALYSEQFTKGYERIIRGILKWFGYSLIIDVWTSYFFSTDSKYKFVDLDPDIYFFECQS